MGRAKGESIMVGLDGNIKLEFQSAKVRSFVHFYNGRGTAKQWITEGKYALKWTRLSCKALVIRSGIQSEEFS